VAAGDPFLQSPLRSADKVRDMPVHPPSAVPTKASPQVGGDLDDEDPVLRDVLQALADGFGGVILAGPPGTSKSWYADRIAKKLTGGDPDQVRPTQFHPSYQYEDFIEGYVPAGTTFDRKPKHLLILCEAARKSKDAGENKLFVLVIDELSRSDPARVFGEALTYVEMTKRDVDFFIASGTQTRIPDNVVILATMNSFDRGVDDVDAAFDRRMAKIEMDPDAAIAEQFLIDAGMEPALRARVLSFFRWLQRLPEKHAHIGHTFFMNVRNEDDLRRRWRFQLVHVFRKAYRLNDDGFKAVQDAWLRIFPTPEQDAGEEDETPVGGSADAALAEASQGPTAEGAVGGAIDEQAPGAAAADSGSPTPA
jgi:5-methylcytosine-specific restriction enzyme B